MGQVFLAASPGGRLVALKLIRPELAEDAGFRARFASEIAAARGVSGAYTAIVIDADADADPPWLATAFVPGPSLGDAVDSDGPLPLRSLLALTAGLAEALAAIHAAGVVHRDLKPSNVLLAADGPRVIDFGISRAVERSTVTTPGMIMGSPGFMSPEQARGNADVGPPADVFSLGAVLVFAAAGEGPFGAGAIPALLYRVVNEEPQLSGVPERLRALAGRCLAKDPAARPTAAEILAELSSDVAELTGEWLPQPVIDNIDRHVRTVRDSAARPGEQTPPTYVVDPDDPWSGMPTTISREMPPSALARASEPDNAPEAGLAQAAPDKAAPHQAAPDKAAPHQAAPDKAAPDKAAPDKAAPDQAAAGQEAPSKAGEAPAAPGQAPGTGRSRRGPGGPRRRWPVAAATAAAIIAASVGLALALAPGSTPRLAGGPSPAIERQITPTASGHQSTPTPSPTRPSATPSRTPTRHPATTASHPATHGATTAPAKLAATTGQATPGAPPTGPVSSPAPTSHPQPTPSRSPTPKPTQPKKTPAPSGAQQVSSFSGAAPVSCTDLGSVWSQPGGSTVSYSFVNSSAADMQVWYLAQNGDVQKGTVAPGNTFGPAVATFQVWMVTNSAGGCLGIFNITGGGAVTVT